MTLAPRAWVSSKTQNLVQKITKEITKSTSQKLLDRIESLAVENRRIHERECFNLNPATNVMNPRAEALLSSRIGSRPSLGYPGNKYEMGLEAIEEIEVITAELCAEVFDAKFAEFRVPSGAIANLYGFMATCSPGDKIIVPPTSIGGHVTHHISGCAGLYGLQVIEAPFDVERFSVDLNRLETLALAENPKLITIGGSLNLFEHPVKDIRSIADRVGAKVLFDAAHQCGIIAGKAWTNPLNIGAHFMTMSTYKSLAGPAGGLIVTNDDNIAESFERIAFPGMTANFDAAKSAALAVTMLDWRDYGEAYAMEMIKLSKSLATALDRLGVAIFSGSDGFTQSHQFAALAEPYGGGQAASKILRAAGFLACGIGLPLNMVNGDLNGLRIGTPELVRWGVKCFHADQLAKLIARALKGEPTLPEVSAWRKDFNNLHFLH